MGIPILIRWHLYIGMPQPQQTRLAKPCAYFVWTVMYLRILMVNCKVNKCWPYRDNGFTGNCVLGVLLSVVSTPCIIYLCVNSTTPRTRLCVICTKGVGNGKMTYVKGPLAENSSCFMHDDDMFTSVWYWYFDGLAQDCSNSSANALQLLWSYIKPSICSPLKCWCHICTGP